MKPATSVFLSLTMVLMLGACADDGSGNEVGATSETGDGDGDPGDGDGDPGDGDGDGDGEPGDGDGDPGDGDGDGDGDGEPGDGDGDGDGDGEPGDGDGEPGDGDGEPGDGDGDGDSNCAITYETCVELTAAFEAETLEIRSCTADSQCGQELPGTSCGCTRNWVATTDADTECFYSLIDQAGLLGCDLGLFSSCDCPEADGFVCESGICQWNYI